MTAPGSILWLMKHELRLFWRRGKGRGNSALLLVLFLGLIWAGISFFLVRGVSVALPPPPFGDTALDGLALAAVSVAVGFIGSIMMSGAVLAAVEAIYTRNDLDLLLSSPLPAWRILAVRACAIAINALPTYLGLLGVPLIWLAILSSPLWLSAIVFLISLAFLATGLALLLVTGLFRLIGPKRTRVMAQIFSAVAGAAIFLGFQYFNIAGRNGSGMTRDQMMQFITDLNIDPNAWWFIPSRAFTGDLLALLIWVAMVAVVFPLGVYIFSRRFVADAAAASGMGKRKRVADARVAQVRGGLMQTVVRKELRLLVRDPLLLSQVGLQLVYFLPLAFILFRPDSGMELNMAAISAALTLLSSTLAASLIWITVSAEDAPDLLASAPVPAGMIDRAKLAAAVGPVLALMTIPLALLLARDTWAGGWAVGGVLAASLCAALVGLWRRTPGSRRDFVRRRNKGSVVAGLGQAVMTMGISGTVWLGATGLPLMAIIPGIITAAILGALYKPAPSRAV